MITATALSTWSNWRLLYAGPLVLYDLLKSPDHGPTPTIGETWTTQLHSGQLLVSPWGMASSSCGQRRPGCVACCQPQRSARSRVLQRFKRPRNRASTHPPPRFSSHCCVCAFVLRGSRSRLLPFFCQCVYGNAQRSAVIRPLQHFGLFPWYRTRCNGRRCQCQAETRTKKKQIRGGTWTRFITVTGVYDCCFLVLAFLRKRSGSSLDVGLLCVQISARDRQTRLFLDPAPERHSEPTSGALPQY